MIEDKEIGLKIAENDVEKFWSERLDNSKKFQKQLQESLYFEQGIQELCEQKLKGATNAG